MRTKPENLELAIIGGGAAGMYAAAVAAERGLSCLLFERKARLGSKVLMTANGRCNFTKDISAEQFLQDLNEGLADADNGRLADFAGEAIRQCPPRRIIKSFQSLNLPLRRMADGRMFPADGKATTIVHAFGDLFRDQEIPVVYNCPVNDVILNNGNNCDARFTVKTRNFSIAANNVLLATGGVSYPKTGSVGDGQNFAKNLGHRLVPYRSGLIGLNTNDPRITRLAGRRFEDGRVKVFYKENTLIYDRRGEIDCENFGLSGAAIYNAQRIIEHQIRAGKKNSDFTIEVWFERNRLRYTGLVPRPVKEAIVTIGGIDLNEVNPKTLASKLIPGLYFAGEVLDIDGPTGGYNLTLAFATARLAVESICLKEKRFK